MWTPERDHELCRLGAKAFAGRYQIPLDEASARYMILFDPEGQAALLREKNKAIEAGGWTPPETVEELPDPWPTSLVVKLRSMFADGYSVEMIARMLGKTCGAVYAKMYRLGMNIKTRTGRSDSKINA